MSATVHAPSARTFTISDLVALVQQGRVRVPDFQRLYRWDSPDILNLFDSIYRGYPIGSLLLWSRPAEAQVVQLGPLSIQAPAIPDALWVIDGQQRITSLAAVLLPPGELKDDRFSVFFDLLSRRFLSGRRPAQRHWLPMNRVTDTPSLLRWLADFQQKGGADSLVQVADDLAKRIREYPVPAYLVQTDDEQTLRTIFDRLNTYGKALKSADVFHALHGGRLGHKPEDLRSLAGDIDALGFGRLDDNTLLRSLLALRGPDVYRDFREEFGTEEDPSDTFQQALAALERAIAFLTREARIPHISLLPYRFVVPVLARFFSLHEEPSPRSQILLRRWVWRDALSRATGSTSVSALRSAVRAVNEDEHGSVQRLLQTVTSSTAGGAQISLAARLNQAKARASIALMASWGPRSLQDGTLLDVPDLMSQRSTPLQSLVRHPPVTLRGSIVDKILHPPTASPILDVILTSHLRVTDEVLYGELLESHCLTLEWIEGLASDSNAEFLALRESTLVQRLEQSAARLAEWGANDRPPIGQLVLDEVDDGD